MFRFNKTGSGTKVLLYAIFIIAHGSTSFICLYINVGVKTCSINLACITYYIYAYHDFGEKLRLFQEHLASDNEADMYKYNTLYTCH